MSTQDDCLVKFVKSQSEVFPILFTKGSQRHLLTESRFISNTLGPNLCFIVWGARERLVI